MTSCLPGCTRRRASGLHSGAILEVASGPVETAAVNLLNRVLLVLILVEL